MLLRPKASNAMSRQSSGARVEEQSSRSRICQRKTSRKKTFILCGNPLLICCTHANKYSKCGEVARALANFNFGTKSRVTLSTFSSRFITRNSKVHFLHRMIETHLHYTSSAFVLRVGPLRWKSDLLTWISSTRERLTFQYNSSFWKTLQRSKSTDYKNIGKAAFENSDCHLKDWKINARCVLIHRIFWLGFKQRN